MHLFIASLVCCVLLFFGGHAEKNEEYCKQNVPKIAEEALLSAIMEKRNALQLHSVGDIEYNYELAKKAVERSSTVGVLEGESTFEDNWNATLKQALTSRKNNMINLARTIGCEITLKTSTQYGSHNVNLYCLLGDKNGKPLNPSVAARPADEE